MTHHPTFHVADLGALAIIMTSFSGYLPAAASLLAIVWYCILIYDRLVNKKGGDAP